MNFLHRLWYRFQEWRYTRKCIKHLGIKPEKIYVSKEAYEALTKAINTVDHEKVKRLKEIMQKPSPWDD